MESVQLRIYLKEDFILRFYPNLLFSSPYGLCSGGSKILKIVFKSWDGLVQSRSGQEGLEGSYKYANKLPLPRSVKYRTFLGCSRNDQFPKHGVGKQ
jgi:hypothetical protein